MLADHTDQFPNARCARQQINNKTLAPVVPKLTRYDYTGLCKLADHNTDHPLRQLSMPPASSPTAVSPRSLSMDKRPKSPPALSLSRCQLYSSLSLFLISIFLSVLITFLLTRNAVRSQLQKTGQEAQAVTAKLVVPEGGIGSLNAGHDITRLRGSGKFLLGNTRQRGNETADAEVELDRKGSEPGAEELRLSGELFPIWYNLTLKVFVPGFGVHISPTLNLTFDGDLLLKFGVNRTTKRIELNALKLRFPVHNLTQYKLSRVDDDGTVNGQAPKVVGIRVDEAREKVFFELDGELTEGAHYTLRIRYSGPIASKLSGLYLTSYTTLSGEHKCAAVTQMEPTDARRMVPSFDEPEFKAIFRLSVIHPEGSSAVSNAKELRERQPTELAEWVRTDFDDTLPMSSYLLALVVSDFEYVEGNTSLGTRFRIWSRKDALNLTSYALRAGIKVLEFYEHYYGIPFPLPKQDMMAFPDFAAGAMENWGLVTYREKYLLYSPDLYTAQQKQAVASVVAHELAHQWFGNLVTMRWWSDLWLNEGFATLMEYLGTDAISDGLFRMDDYFLVEALDSAFDRDSRITSHPLFFEIRKAEDVTEAFDSITYSKGASVLRMIRAVMGEEHFKKGLNIYLTRFKYRNAEHTDLWDALTEAVPEGMKDWKGNNFSVKQFARQWTEQTGYPIVQVQRLDDRRVQLSQQRFRMDPDSRETPEAVQNSSAWEVPVQRLDDRRVQLNQQRFRMDPDSRETLEAVQNSSVWEVPVWWSLNGESEPMEWLKDNCILNATDSDVLVLNSRSQGFYRVHYSADGLQHIQSQLFRDHKNLSLASRTRLIDDTFTLAEAGYIAYEAPLNLSKYLVEEKDYPPWEMALAGFSTIQNYFEDEPEAGPMRAYIKQIINTLFERALPHIKDQRDDEEHFFDNLLRHRIVQRMCTLRDDRCISAILNIYADGFVRPCQSAANLTMSSGCSRIPAPFRALAYCEGIHYGAERDWDFVFRMFRIETVQVEKERLLLALACSRDTHTLKRLLSLAADASSTVIRLQDKPSVFSHVASRIIGKKIVLDFFIDHWNEIYEDFKDQQTLLRSIISSSIVGKSKRVIDQMEQFLRDNERTTKNLDVFKQRLEVLQTNRRWMDRNFAPLAEWFRQHGTPLDDDELFQPIGGPIPSPIA
uniref:Peptidase_M1 domain-containing protein n=1 Tax=Globodera pallida TaxID=36090 RepID=A0A183BZM7_GLOPA